MVMHNHGHFSSGPTTYVEKCKHPGTKPVIIGGKKVYLGANWDIPYQTLEQMDLILPLNGYIPANSRYGSYLPIISCELPDRGGLPTYWKIFMERMIEYIKKNKKLIAYCTGSHGRTGAFGASLIALMEPDVKDPIAAIRKRHCKKAVESFAQAEGIFKLKDMEVPEKYVEEFTINEARWKKWLAKSNHGGVTGVDDDGYSSYGNNNLI